MVKLIDMLEKITSKSLKLPMSFIWYGVGVNVFTYTLYSTCLEDIICKKCYLRITLILTIVIIIFLVFYNFYFYFGKKNKKNIIINLYSEDKNIDKYVYDIKIEMEAILEENGQNDVNIIVPNYCRRANFSKSFLKKCKNKIYLTKSKVYKVFNKLWNSQIIIFGDLKERKNINQKIVINNKILIDINILKDEQLKELNLITKVKSQNDQFLVLNKDEEYVEFKKISHFFTCIAKYYIGIGYYLSGNINNAYFSHKFIIDKDKKITKYIELDKFFYLESLYIINKYIDKGKYIKALECANFLINNNIEKENSIMTKMSVMMYSTKNIFEFKAKIIECFKLMRILKVTDSSHGILTKAYLELCRGNYERALKIYYAHFQSVEISTIDNYCDVIKYCSAAKNKIYEKEIAEFCLTCIYLGLGDYSNFKKNLECLKDVNQNIIKNSYFYNIMKNRFNE